MTNIIPKTTGGYQFIITENQNYTEEFILTVDGIPIYHGEAEVGTATSSTGWRIKKFTYDSNMSVKKIQWANGDDEFDKVMASATTYSYS